MREVELISSRKHSLILLHTRPFHSDLRTTCHRLAVEGLGENRALNSPSYLEPGEYLSRAEPRWLASSRTHIARGLYSRARLLSGCVAILWRPLGSTRGPHDRRFMVVQTRGRRKEASLLAGFQQGLPSGHGVLMLVLSGRVQPCSRMQIPLLSFQVSLKSSFHSGSELNS